MTTIDDVSDMAVQMEGLWKRQTAPFVQLIDDYQACLRAAREAQVRAAQLDKEAGEVRSENDTILQHLEALRRSSISLDEYQELQARLSQLESELTTAYREKATLAETSLQTTQQLGIVRDISERQAKELIEANAVQSRLHSEAASLRASVERLEEIVNTAGREAQARREEAAAATAALEAARADAAALSRRLVEMKEEQVERMNDINRQRDELLASARNQAAELLAEANAKVAKTGSLRADAPRTVGLAGGARAEEMDAGAALPTEMMHSYAHAHEAGCFGLAFNRPGTILASCGTDKTVKLWDVIAGPLGGPTTVLHGCFESVNAVAWSLDASRVVAAENRSALRVWSATTGRLTGSLTGHSGRVVGVAASPVDGNLVASCGSDRTIKLWGLERGYCMRTIMCHSSCNAVGWAQAGTLLASVHFDGNLRLWDAASGRQANEIAGLHAAQVCALDVSADGTIAATAGKDNTVRIIDLRGPRVLCTLSSKALTIGAAWQSLALAADAKHLATGSADGGVLIWDLAAAAAGPLSRLAPPRAANHAAAAPVTALAWSPLGAPLVVGCKQGDITFWDSPGGR